MIVHVMLGVLRGSECVRGSLVSFGIFVFFFFFNDTATTEIYTFPTRRSSDLRGAKCEPFSHWPVLAIGCHCSEIRRCGRDRKSTRLNSSHTIISYAVFCLKKTKKDARLLVLKSTAHPPAAPSA